MTAAELRRKLTPDYLEEKLLTRTIARGVVIADALTVLRLLTSVDRVTEQDILNIQRFCQEHPDL